MKLDPKDRKLLLYGIAGLAVLAFLVAAVAPTEDGDIGYPSSYSPQSSGAKAAFLTLKELGYHVQRWERPPGELPQEEAAGAVLILADPFFSFEAEDKSELERFLARGGRVIATGVAGAYLLPQHDIGRDDTLRLAWHECPPALPSRLTRGGPITLVPMHHWGMSRASHIGHYACDDRAVVVSYPVGEGEIIWWASSVPLTNAGIDRPGNLELLLNSVGAPEERRVLWDEYFHGFRRRSLFATIYETPARWALAQLGLFALALLVTFSRRSGPVRPLFRRPRLSPLEFVDTLGGLYERAHATRVPVEVAYQRFRYRLARRLGISAQASPAELARSARAQLGFEDEAFPHLLASCDQAAHDLDLADADALKLVQQLSHYSERLHLLPSREKD